MNKLGFELSGKPEDLHEYARYLGTEARVDETDDELRARLNKRIIKFENNSGSFYDFVHIAEQAILYETPIGCNYIAIRRQVGLGMIAKNKTGNWLERLKTACRAFLSCL